MPKVMVIEDDQTMVSLLKILLELEGFTVTIPPADDQRDYASIVWDEQPDIILLDVHLSQKNGLDILRQIRQRVGPQHPRILMTSGMDVSADCYQSGADAFLLKPYLPDTLVAMIRKQISG